MSKQNTSASKHSANPKPLIPAKAGISDTQSPFTSQRLLDLYDRVADAPDAVGRLRKFVLDLAVRGKLVEQNEGDESAEELLKRVAAEKAMHSSGRGGQKMGGACEDDSSFAIPQNWVWIRLGDISLRLHYGYTASASKAEKEVRLLRITDIQNDHVDWANVPGCEIDADSYPRYALEQGDLLIARTGGTIGKTFLVTEAPIKSVFASYLIRVQPARSVFARYIKLFCGSGLYWDQLLEGARGGGQPNVNGKTLSNLKVPLPPLTEQHRIVARVEELMTLLDSLKTTRTQREGTRDRLTTASLTRLSAPDATKKDFATHVRFALHNLHELTARSEQMKKLRQTILNLAVRGKLVEQDPGDEPATRLLEQISQAKKRLGISHSIAPLSGDEVPFELPSGWTWTRLGEICSKTGSGSTPRGGKAVYRKSGIPFLRSQNVHNDGFQLDDVAFIDPQIHKKMKGTRVLPGDLLLNITGGSIGRCCQVPENFEEANVSQHVAIIRPAVIGMADFLHELILSPYFQSFIFDEQTGAGRGGLPKKRMDKIAVALPPLQEQRRIVAKVDTLLALCDRMKSAMAKADTNKTRLLQSLLHALLSEEDQKREFEPV